MPLITMPEVLLEQIRAYDEVTRLTQGAMPAPPHDACDSLTEQLAAFERLQQPQITVKVRSRALRNPGLQKLTRA